VDSTLLHDMTTLLQILTYVPFSIIFLSHMTVAVEVATLNNLSVNLCH